MEIENVGKFDKSCSFRLPGYEVDLAIDKYGEGAVVSIRPVLGMRTSWDSEISFRYADGKPTPFGVINLVGLKHQEPEFFEWISGLIDRRGEEAYPVVDWCQENVKLRDEFQQETIDRFWKAFAAVEWKNCVKVREGSKVYGIKSLPLSEYFDGIIDPSSQQSSSVHSKASLEASGDTVDTAL